MQEAAKQEESQKPVYTWFSLPEILTAQHIATYLTISRRRVYELFQIKPEFGGIPNFEIGNSKRVDKEDLKAWIDARKKEKAVKGATSN